MLTKGYDQVFFSREADGTIAKWYVFAWYGSRFAVSPIRNAKLRDYKRYYGMEDIGKTLFSTRREAKARSMWRANNDTDT